MKTSIDVCRQTSRFYAQAKAVLRNFCYCSDDVKCMYFVHFALICIVTLYGLTLLHLA